MLITIIFLCKVIDNILLERTCMYATGDTPIPAVDENECRNKSGFCYNKFSNTCLPAVISESSGKVR